jgi:hypothetical protein
MSRPASPATSSDEGHSHDGANRGLQVATGTIKEIIPLHGMISRAIATIILLEEAKSTIGYL